MIEILYLVVFIYTKELNRLAVFKTMVNVILILRLVLVVYLHNKLVERVVIALACRNWIPAQSRMNLALDAHLLCLNAEFFFLRFIFHCQQLAKLL